MGYDTIPGRYTDVGHKIYIRLSNLFLAICFIFLAFFLFLRFLFSIYFMCFFFYNSWVTLPTLIRKHKVPPLYPCSYNNNNNLYIREIIVIVTHNLSHFLCNISPDVSSFVYNKHEKKIFIYTRVFTTCIQHTPQI